MKTRRLLFTAIALTGLVGTTQAQITIDASEYPTPQSPFRMSYEHAFNEVDFVSPTTGANQYWDYTGIQANGVADFPYFISTNPFFVGSHHYEAGRLILGSFKILSDFHSGLDAFGYYHFAKQQYDTTYSLTATTGDPNDNLHFLDDSQMLVGFDNVVFFPLAYQGQWVDTFARTTPFEITIAAFGLNNTPGEHKRIDISNKEVVGYGKLQMTHTDGMPSDSMDVLQVQIIRTKIDSFFVGGAPAPTALLTAMGLTQGSSVTSTTFKFYREGYGDCLLEMEVASATPGSAVDNMFFNIDGTIQNTVGIEDVAVASVNIYPSPVNAGGSLTIELQGNTNDLQTIELLSIDGRVVSSQKIDNFGQHPFSFEIPTGLATGSYIVKGFSRTSNTVFSKRILIQ